MIVATAGHVDHGKTSLVQALTGVDTDRLKEEKQRGLTIDLGFAYTNTETGHRIGFVDVPGHIRFINNMLAGVSAIDLALLVVAADDGVMPQTREHLDVLQILGIPAGVIALTKTDRVAPERIDVVLAEIEQLVASTFLEGAEVYPVSCLTGDGMDTLQLALDIAVEETRAKAESGYF
ncbi:MAG: GTP-binding protein, partial [Pseudomonadales bacterium]